MNSYKLYKLHYVFSWLLLASVASCQCKLSASTSPIQEATPVETTPPKGIWHTGKFDKKITPTIPDHTIIPDLYKHTFHVYKVTHDGSCSYRSFIPILLAEILVQDKWKDWLENMRTTFYEPAKAILQPLDLTGTKYIQFRPTDNPDKLLGDTKNLLQELSQEPAPRSLQEPEIKLLVSFLRQTILMNKILISNESLKIEQPATRVPITQKIDDFFQAAEKRDRKDFWSYDTDFLIFCLPFYTALFQNAHTNSYYIIYYIHPTGKPTFTNPAEDMRATIMDPPPEPDYPTPIPDRFLKQVPPIWLYHHDNMYFEYLVYEEEEEGN